MSATIQQVSPDELIIEPSVQRPLSLGQARAIAKVFDPNALGVIEITVREDGKYTINDGQTRVAAAKLAKYDGTFYARVHNAATEQEQAELFLKLNDQRTVNAVDKFKVAVTAGHELPVLVDRVLRGYGWSVGYRMARRTTAINALLHLAKRGEEQLDRTVKIIEKAWDGAPASMSRIMVRAIGNLVMDYGWFDTDHMIESLKEVTVTGLTAKANAAYQTSGMGQHAAMLSLIVSQYNKGLRSSKRIQLTAADMPHV